jgi:hypothetical protein
VATEAIAEAVALARAARLAGVPIAARGRTSWPRTSGPSVAYHG